MKSSRDMEFFQNAAAVDNAAPRSRSDEDRAAALKACAAEGTLGFEPLPLDACVALATVEEMRPPGFHPLDGRPGTVHVPKGAADLTPAFCTSAFRARSLLSAEESVTEVSLTPIGAGEGEASDNYLMTLEVDGDAPKLARKLIAKFTSPKMSRVEKAYNFSPEAHFYNDMTVEACGLMRPNAPYVGYAAPTREGPSRYCIIQEFCAPPAFLVKRHEGLGSVAHLLLVMRSLARFHARWWDHEQSGILKSYVHPDKLGGPFIHVPRLATETALVLMWKWGLKALRHCWSDAPKYAGAPTFAAEYKEFVELIRPLARRRRKSLVLEMSSRKPLTIVHGDAHLENIFFGPNYPGGVAFIDFGLLSFGPAMVDVATILGGGMPTEARRAHEKELVRAYYDALTTEFGVRDFGYEACWEGYRFQLIRPFLCAATLPVPRGSNAKCDPSCSRHDAAHCLPDAHTPHTPHTHISPTHRHTLQLTRARPSRSRASALTLAATCSCLLVSSRKIASTAGAYLQQSSRRAMPRSAGGTLRRMRASPPR